MCPASRCDRDGHPMIMLRDETRQQVAAGVIVEDGAWLGKLHGELRGLLAPVFAQARSRLTAFAYIGALLAERGDRKSCWQLAEAGRACHAAADAGAAGRARLGLEGGAGRAAAVHPRAPGRSGGDRGAG